MTEELEHNIQSFPSMSVHSAERNSVRESVAVMATAIREGKKTSPAARALVEELARLPDPSEKGALTCRAVIQGAECTSSAGVHQLYRDDLTKEQTLVILKSFKVQEWDHWPCVRR